ncbi:lectin-like domain-containing protein [Xylocopilactobacillus apis]|uniref:Gram-positive cocci surface proteins LPxTG domain-containing protein n=1 Tax=Xylocopilactobacillus apis TaxID=2932183 RepID=A0AAU9CYM0_9LACO|nr:MucBP domain-containing protein [Xylocopilactobacillus apis]BDR57531.1 hypothetical protein KIMC2_20930 [Xylocopilactobacillus apis]
MKFRNKKYILMDEKVHYKMYKSGKKWVVAGITTFGLVLGIGTAASSVKADAVPQWPSAYSNNKSLADNLITSNPSVSAQDISSQAEFGSINVTPSNFQNYFNMNGDAKWDAVNGILTLTPDLAAKTGNATLKTKISVNDNFSLKGQVNLGNKSAGQGGADGIGIAFHTGSNDLIGAAGGCLGIAGLPDGFGFKLDTYWDPAGAYGTSSYDQDPVRFHTASNQSFGSFAYDKIISGRSTVYTYDGSDAPATKITEPINNQFLPFEANYTGSDHVLTVTYDGKTWKKSLDAWIPQGTTSLSFAIAGVTGGNRNLQQFKLESFAYTGYGVANTKFVGPDGKDITTPTAQANAKVGDQISLTDAIDKIKSVEKGGEYYLASASISTGATTADTSFDATTASITATEQPQTITYKFEKNKSSLKGKDITIYEGQTLDPKDGFDSGTAKDGSALSYGQIQHSGTVDTNTPGSYDISYTYAPNGFQNTPLPTVTAKSTVKVVARKHITLNYVDQKGNPIDSSLLTGLADDIKNGEHSGDYGTSIVVDPIRSLTLNNKEYYTFDHANLDQKPLTTPAKITFGDFDQVITLVYKGAVLPATDTNAVTVHYYLKDKTGTETKTPVLNDAHIGGQIGETVTVQPAAAPAGYTLAPNQTSQSWTLTPNSGKEFTFYYTANLQNNISIEYVDANTSKTVGTDKPGDYYTGDELDISKGGSGLAKLPDGFHYATEDELKDKGFKQPSNPTYTNTPQTEKVYVVGNEVKATDANALTIHYYLRDKSGTNTTKSLKPDRKVGGRVGTELTIATADPAQAAPAGYTLAADQKDQKYTFDPVKPGEISFYYTANDQTNLTVKFVNARTSKTVVTDKPVGKTDDTLDLTETSDYVKGKIPKGYHYAKTADELNGKIQPENPTYKDTPQEVTVYLAGDEIQYGQGGALIHFINNRTQQEIPNAYPKQIFGYVGDIIKIDPYDQNSLPIPTTGYTPVPNQQPVTIELNGDTVQDISFYYDPDQLSNITVNFTNAKNNETVLTDNPIGYVDDVLDISENSNYVKSKMPKGYHYATDDELMGRPQTPNPTFHPMDPGNVNVYIAGDEVSETVNADCGIKVHHYLQGTTKTVPGMTDGFVGGKIGDKIIVYPGAQEHAAPKGYTLVPGQQPVEWQLSPNGGKEIIIYYTANTQDNIKVDFVNAKNDNVIKTDTPTGHHTGDILDLTANSDYVKGQIPDGYHYADGDELNGKTQPKNPEYGPTGQDIKVYLAGDKVENSAENAVKIHHYIQGTTKTVPGMSDTLKGGFVGDTITVSPKDDDQKAPKGYTIVPGQETVKWELKANEGKEIIFYYTADEQTNLTVHFVNAKNDNEVTTDNPAGKTGDTLNLSAAGDYLKDKMPKGYHYATGDELNGKAQPENPEYKATPQDVTVYIAGDKVENNAANGIKIHHYLQGTTTTVPGMSDTLKGGFVGDTITVSPEDNDQKAPDGYTIVPGQETVKWDLKANEGKEIIFYYTANELSNLTVHFVNAKNDNEVTHDNPAGKTGDTLNLSAAGDYLKDKMPKGYHYATGDELNGKTQPENPEYKATPQDVTVYIAGDKVADDGTADNGIKIHHYLQGTTKTVPGMSDTFKGGLVGDTLTISPEDDDQTAPDGYTIVPGQETVKWELKADEGKEIIFYYTANEQNNLTIHFVNAKNDNEVAHDNPVGKTDDILDISATGDYIKGKMPKGYHYAKETELNGKTQPTENPTFKAKGQDVTIYVAGDEIDGHDANGVKIHHYLKDTTTNVPGMTDTFKGGLVGDTLTISPEDDDQKAPDGYTIVPGQETVKWELNADGGKEITYYYTANTQDNITIDFVDANTKETVGSIKPTGHVTGDKLDLSENSKDLGKIPDGFHYATADELKDLGFEQPKEITYTTKEQTEKVYVIGNDVKDTDSNALTIHYYLKDKDGKETTTSLKPDRKVGGRVGTQTIISAKAKEQEIPGYTIVSEDQKYTFEASKPGEVTFYYTADAQNNITINFIDANTKETVGTITPSGHITGDELDLSENSKDLAGKLPNGYHYATTDELNKLGLEQPKNPTYTDDVQTENVYVVGNRVNTTDKNAVTVHYYLQDKLGNNTTTSVLPDSKIGGRVGQKVTASAATAPDGYEVVPGQEPQDWVLKADEGKAFTFYYKAATLHSIGVDFVNAKTGKTIVNNDQPAGKTGDILDLSSNSDYIKGKMPKGYHYSTPSELNGKTQPENLTYTTTSQKATVYITGESDESIEIAFVDIDSGETLNTNKPTGYYTGDTLDLTPTSKEIAGKIPEGYHYATEKELSSKSKSQPANQEYDGGLLHTVIVYIAASKVSDDSESAVTIHYYLQDKDNKPTEIQIRPDRKAGGRFNETLHLDSETETIPDGYTAVPKKQDVKITSSKGQEVTFYYKGNARTNINIEFKDTKGNTVQAAKTSSKTYYNGNSLELFDKDGKFVDQGGVTKPSGYEVTPEAKLKALGLEQPTICKPGQTLVTVYVDKAAQNLVVEHRVRSINGALVQGMKTTTDVSRPDGTFSIDVNEKVHRAPSSKYKLSGYAYELNNNSNTTIGPRVIPGNGIITVRADEVKDGKITLIYMIR